MQHSYPYISARGNVQKIINHLRENIFPEKISVEDIKNLGIASGEEGKVINVLKFINVIDKNGNKNADAARIFALESTQELFQEEFGKLIGKAYSELFNLHGKGAWKTNKEQLDIFFGIKKSKGASAAPRKAITFIALAELAGKREPTNEKTSDFVDSATKGQRKQDVRGKASKTVKLPAPNSNNKPVLTVRIEVNLPAGDTKENYDNIFKGIREHLING